MRLWIYGFFMAWGMFLALPCPFPKWDEAARGRMMVCFPLTGLVVGAIWCAAALIPESFPTMLRAFLIAVVPWLCTGFIHLDGYMDVSDAVLSRRDLETRQRILKDSHCGAFAVISIMLLMLAQWSAAAEVSASAWPAILLIPVAVRGCASVAVTMLRRMHTSQYANMAKDSKSALGAAAVSAAAVILGFVLGGILGFAVLVPCAVYWLAVWYGFKQLDGMNGDISGFALCLGELSGMIVIAVMR